MKLILIFFVRFFSALDFLFRQLVRWLFAVAYPYERSGSCLCCGQCCRAILITMDPKFLRRRFIRNFAVWWNKYFNNMHLVGIFIEDGYMVFSCDNQNEDGTCGNYFWRPFFCREYPRAFGYFERPTTLAGCGYLFNPKKKQ